MLEQRVSNFGARGTPCIFFRLSVIISDNNNNNNNKNNNNNNTHGLILNAICCVQHKIILKQKDDGMLVKMST
jgi:hypothetical protein